MNKPFSVEINQIKDALKSQGRYQQWLANQTLYSEEHVCKVLNFNNSASKRFIKSCYQALGLNFFDTECSDRNKHTA